MAQRRSSNPFTFWTDMAAAGVATAVTLSIRLPQIATGTMTATESSRMVGEKIMAARAGLAAGSAAAARIAARRLLAPAPHRVLSDALDIAMAASRPAHRRVSANAKRLSKGRRLP